MWNSCCWPISHGRIWEEYKRVASQAWEAQGGWWPCRPCDVVALAGQSAAPRTALLWRCSDWETVGPDSGTLQLQVCAQVVQGWGQQGGAELFEGPQRVHSFCSPHVTRNIKHQLPPIQSPSCKWMNVLGLWNFLCFTNTLTTNSF